MAVLGKTGFYESLVSLKKTAQGWMEHFTDGWDGQGWKIFKVDENRWRLTIDELIVRKAMYVYELVISKIRAIAGQILVSPANGKIKTLREDANGDYVVTFEDTNMFQVGDFVRCRTWTGRNIKDYWLRVGAVDGEDVTLLRHDDNGKDWLSMGEIAIGDELVLMGSENEGRQDYITIAADGTTQPRIEVHDKVDSREKPNTLRAAFGGLENVSDEVFGGLHGYGIYCDNAYLKGRFLFRTSTFADEDGEYKSIDQVFDINNGKVRSEIASASSVAAREGASNAERWIEQQHRTLFEQTDRLVHFITTYSDSEGNMLNGGFITTNDWEGYKKEFAEQLNGQFENYVNENETIKQWNGFYTQYVKDGKIVTSADMAIFLTTDADGNVTSNSVIRADKIKFNTDNFKVWDKEEKTLLLGATTDDGFFADSISINGLFRIKKTVITDENIDDYVYFDQYDEYYTEFELTSGRLWYEFNVSDEKAKKIRIELPYVLDDNAHLLDDVEIDYRRAFVGNTIRIYNKGTAPIIVKGFVQQSWTGSRGTVYGAGDSRYIEDGKLTHKDTSKDDLTVDLSRLSDGVQSIYIYPGGVLIATCQLVFVDGEENIYWDASFGGRIKCADYYQIIK